MGKRVVAIVLVVFLMFGVLAACSSRQIEPPQQAIPMPTQTPAVSPPLPVPPSPEPPPDLRGQAGVGWNPLDYGGAFERFEETVNITIGVFEHNRDDAPPVSDNFWTQWVQAYFGDNLNITVEYLPLERDPWIYVPGWRYIPPPTPTINMQYYFDIVYEWLYDGKMQEIDRELFAHIAPTWLETSGGFDLWDQFMLYDKTYAAPARRPFWDTNNYKWVTFYRLDWHEEHDLGRPASYEDWLAVQVIFKEAYDLPYTLDVGAFTRDFQFYSENPFPLEEEYWVMYSSVLMPSLPAIGAYRALKKMNQQYHLGLINPDFDLDVAAPSDEQTHALQAFIDGRLYQHSFFAQPSMPELTAFYENNPGAKLGIMWNNTVQYAGADAMGYSTHPQERAWSPAGLFLGFSSEATDDEIKAAYMYLEWMAQPDVLEYFQWGEEGRTFNYIDGQRVLIPWDEQGDMWMGFNGNQDYWAVVVDSRMTEKDAESIVVGIIPENIPASEVTRLRQEQLDRYRYLRVRADHGLAYNDPIIIPYPFSLTEYWRTLPPLFIELATELVKADPEEFDAMYEAHVATYRAAGFQEIEDERRQAFHYGIVTRLNPIARGEVAFEWWEVGSVTENVYR